MASDDEADITAAMREAGFSAADIEVFLTTWRKVVAQLSPPYSTKINKGWLQMNYPGEKLPPIWHPIRRKAWKEGRLSASGRAILPPTYWRHGTHCGCTACQERRADEFTRLGSIQEHAPVTWSQATLATRENSQTIHPGLLIRGNPIAEEAP